MGDAVSDELRLLVVDVGELVFRLEGEPGRRVVVITREDGMPYGQLPYAQLMDDECGDTFYPDGDRWGCHENDIAMVGVAGLDELRYWAEQQALGAAATGEEAYD